MIKANTYSISCPSSSTSHCTKRSTCLHAYAKSNSISSSRSTYSTYKFYWVSKMTTIIYTCTRYSLDFISG